LGESVARILVTGAAGFIGEPVCRALVARGEDAIAGTRGPAAPVPGVEPRPLGEIGPQKNWSCDLRDVDIVIHLAQRAHRAPDATALATEANSVALLTRAAAEAGVQRLVLISSIKAMGEATTPGRPFRADDEPRPEDVYGSAKLASERKAASIAREFGIELTILRPPLVYGPGVKGNFRALLQLAASGLPLPLAAINNRRSLIFLDNLVDLIAAAALHPAAAGRVLLARDGQDLSTPGLIRTLAESLGRPAALFPIPGAVFAALRRFPLVGPPLCRLTLSLQVDDSATRAALGWVPPVAAEAGLAATARAFAAQR